METVLKSAVFSVLFFTESIAPICDLDSQIAAGNDPDPWDEDRRWDTDQDYMTYYCVWKSWSSWSSCSRGKKTRYRVEEDDVNNCRCDIEFQTHTCRILGKSSKFGVLLSAVPQWARVHQVNNESGLEKFLSKYECSAAHSCANWSCSFLQSSLVALCSERVLFIV